MNKSNLKSKVNLILAILWLAFTFSLVAWWWVFFLVRFNPENPDFEQTVARSHKMFAWEGSILLAAILMGGIALVVFSYRDNRRHERLRFFFSTFSHDIKTSITRLRLQGEVLEEEFNQSAPPVLKRLITDIRRLDLQLENSLLLANESQLLNETCTLATLFSTLKQEFSDLSIELSHNAEIKGDHRALLSVFKNLLQNSVLHGKATHVKISVSELPGQIQLEVQDNGKGFEGSAQKLGMDILKSQDSRSNGIGLLIARRLLLRMNGDIRFESSPQGFKSVILLKGHRV